MTKTFITFALCFLLSPNLFSQNCNASLGAIKIHAFAFFDQARDLVWTPEGDLVIAGISNASANGGDGVILKLNNSGDPLWMRVLFDASALPESTRFRKIKQTSDGGYIIVGTIGNANFPGDVLLVKTSDDGQIVWAHRYDYPQFPDGALGYDVIQMEDGGYALAAVLNNFDRGGIVRTDANGVPLWGKVMNGPSNDFFYSLVETSDGGLLAVGSGNSFHIGLHDFLLVRFGSDGDVIWQKQLGSMQNEGFGSIKSTPDGGFILAGNTWEHAAGAHVGTALVKLDEQANIIWAKQYGIEGKDYRSDDVNVTSSGAYLLPVNEQPDGPEDFLMQIDEQGNPEWAYRYDYPTPVKFWGIQASNEGCIAAAGRIQDTMTLDRDLFVWDVGPSPCRIAPDIFEDDLPLIWTDADYSFTDWTDWKTVNFIVHNLSPNEIEYLSCSCPPDPILDLGPDVVLCEDSTVVFDAGPGFVSYLWQDNSTAQTFAAMNSGIYWVEVVDSCGNTQRDSVLLTVSLLGDVKLADTSLCAGDAITLSVPGFDAYAWAPAAGLSCTDCATVTVQPDVTTTYTLFASTSDGCVKADTFTVTIIPLPMFSDTIEFCPGESVTIGGQTYTQPAVLMDTIPDPNGCNIVATYVLQFVSAPNSSISIDCIEDVNIPTLPGTGAIPVDYDLPIFISDCPCPGVELTLTQGLPPGSLFPVDKTKVCYEARDSCGNVDTCCFNIIVREALPCDIKEIGCMRYELLRITQNSAGQRSYRIRVINKCATPMIYTAFELPDGTKAVAPPDNSIYTSPDNRNYEVRNPNFSPFYSIRFKSTTDSISNGESDVFRYTLPPQSEPVYIHVTSRLFPQQFFEAYLNTFNCPVEPENKPQAQVSTKGTGLRVFPNPTSGNLFVDLSEWTGEQVQLRMLGATGQELQVLQLTADAAPQEVHVPRHLPEGLYFLEIQTARGEKHTVRFVVQR